MLQTSKLLGAITLVAMITLPLPALADDSLGELSVVGSAEIAVKPDVATVNAGAVYLAPTVDEARSKSEKAISTMVENLKGLVTNDKDIVAEDITVTPTYDYIDGKRILRGYTSRRFMSIKTSDFNQIPQIMAIAVKSGLNQITNVSYSVKNESKARMEVRKLAIVDAREKAKSVAEGFNVKINGISSITYDTTYSNNDARMMRTMSLSKNSQGDSINDYDSVYRPDDVIFSDSITAVYEVK